ncbi:hypothetical protein R3P38DRAFT_2825400 [Favolaschia claudopus]|uniref:DUF6533 domain-containing protein n=1 Tax=Favolaschia claudopus TaxID=2862362 RepID=A0AAW0EK04_9AGAR
MSNESIFDPAQRLQLVKYFCAASLTLQGYDWLICLDREVKTVWASPWRGPKILYLLARYIPFINLSCALYYYVAYEPSELVCRRTDAVATWFTALGIIVSEAMLIMRTYAVFDSSKKILIFLLVLLLFLIGAALPTTEIFIRSLQYGKPPIGTINGCYPVSGSEIIFVAFVAILLFETVIVALTVWSAFKHYRRSSSRLVKVLYRDSLFFFLCIFSITLASVLVAALLPIDYADLLDRLQSTIHSIVSARIIFHLRTQHQSDLGVGNTTRANALSMSLRFIGGESTENDSQETSQTAAQSAKEATV